MRVARAGASLLLAGALGLCCAGAAVAVQPGAAHAATSKVTASVKTAVTNKSKITFSFTGKLQSVTVNGHKVKPKVKWNAKRTAGKFTYTFKYQKKHVFKVKVEGKSAKKITRTYDKTKPTVKFTKYGSTVVVGSTITAKDKSGIKSITANGTRVRNGYQIKKGGTYTFKVTDKAGNVRTTKVTVKSPIWKTRSVSGGVEIAGTSTRILAAYIPSTVGGQKVVAIGANAFRGKERLAKVVVPEGVKTLGLGCFDDCVKLTDITLPSTLQTINDYAFFYCTRLTSIKLPSRLKTIGEGAFFGTGLKTVTIPNSVTSLGKAVFARCDSLTSATVGTGVTKIPARCFHMDGKLKTCKLPDGITEIGDRAFLECRELTALNLTSALKTLGEGALCYCDGLRKLTVAASSIGRNALVCGVRDLRFTGKNVQFEEGALGASEVERFTLSAGVTRFDATALSGSAYIVEFLVEKGNQLFSVKDGVLYSADGKTLVCYPGGRGTTFTVPAEVEVIGRNAFSNCSMDSLRFAAGSKLRKIEDGAFEYLTLEGELVLPASLNAIGERAFQHAQIKAVDFNQTAVTKISSWTFEEANVPSVRMEDSQITELADYAFHRSYDVKELRLPKGLERMGTGAVALSAVKRFVMEGNSHFCVEDGVLYNADKTELVAYPAASDEAAPVIPESVTRIGSYAFYGTSHVIEPEFPEGLKEIGDYAFVPKAVQSDGTYDERVLRVPANVESVGEGAFGYMLNDLELVKKANVLLISKSAAVKDYAMDPANDFAYATATPRMSVKSCSLDVGEQQRVRVVNAPEGFRFFSSNKSICTVDEKTGLITAVKDGQTYVVAAMGSYYLRCMVSVSGESDPVPPKYPIVDPDDRRSWEKAYYKHNPMVNFAALDSPAVHLYTTQEFKVLFKSIDPTTELESSDAFRYGEDLVEYRRASSDVQIELLKHKLHKNTMLVSGTESASPYTGAGSSFADMEAAVGKVFTNPLMVSTSLDMGVALSFRGYPYPTVLHVQADANGTPGGYIARMSQYDTEYELLMAPSVQYQVIDYGVYWYQADDEEYSKGKRDYVRYMTLKPVGVSPM
ncbi:MAG: leucine-rich repeat protein [Coriobacteriia bacterium]|nr:leucine-rich repeat protein [Coriobacteriia bacterium]